MKDTFTDSTIVFCFGLIDYKPLFFGHGTAVVIILKSVQKQ